MTVAPGASTTPITAAPGVYRVQAIYSPRLSYDRRRLKRKRFVRCHARNAGSAMTSNRRSEHLHPVTSEVLCCAIDVQPGINNMLACSLAVHDDHQPHIAFGDDGSILGSWTTPQSAPMASDPGYAATA